ncbi:MAG: glycosyltransferase family 2 protein [Proteiniphilum sp.]|jgi:hypothetical protein|nr:glycosyltransferase family 2 protein [Proteiniphilum sp.]
MQKINAFIPYTEPEQAIRTVEELKRSASVYSIFLLTPDATSPIPDGCERITVDRLQSTAAIRKIVSRSMMDYTLIHQRSSALKLGYFALERMIRVAEETGAGMVYADYRTLAGGERREHPLIDCQEGSLRDDFDFGPLLLYEVRALREAAAQMDDRYLFAGLYDLRLKVSQQRLPVHIGEYLCTEMEEDRRTSGEKLFDYVDPKNRHVQEEMERACTQHLKMTGAYLSPRFEEIDLDEEHFEYEASVIIPVRNRISTVEDAITSALEQKTGFHFNLIVVDNHSTDGTTQAIAKFGDDPRLIHLIPERDDLGIGGCWNLAVHHPRCGKFAVQLDSDDVYSGDDSLQKIVDAFYQQRCAMIVGSYRMTNFRMEEIPPGIIDHREWTPDNGRNNALRINGLGAPRAFYTPVLREIRLPDTSYGEDYALGLNISRRYRIGRIYDVLYLCRRWKDNSDAALDVVRQNAHNRYKDSIRTWEIAARKSMNSRYEP